MKILLSALACGPGEGSEPGTGWHWATTLADLGHDVTVLTMASYREPILASGRQDIDFRFIDIPKSPLPAALKQLWTYDIYQRWQDAALRHIQATGQRFDIAHHVTWGSLQLGSPLWRLPRPLVFGPVGGGQTAPASYWREFGRDLPVETLRTAASSSPLLRLNGRTRDTVRNSAVTLVCNSATAAASERLGAADVRYMLADGLPGNWLVSGRSRPSGIPIVVWVGRLLPRKAPVLAVRAFAALRQVMPARMVVAGDGPLRGEMLATISRLGLEDDVEMLGSIPWDEARRLYDTATVLLFTSLRESFGAPFLEALGRGLPAVALELHGIADAEVGTAAVKVPLPARPADLPARIAAGLQAVLSDDQWELRSAAALSWASRWTWPVKAATMIRIYEEILQGRG